MHVAHRAEDGREQSIIEHSTHTAEKCWQFALEPWKAFFYEIALTHDIGKYQERFQKRIRGESIHAPHALCGAQFWRNLYGRTVWSMMAQYVIAGHHAGLPDYGSKADDPFDSTLCGTNKRACEDYSICAAELPLEKKDFSEIEVYIATGCTTISDAAERFAFFTRYCYSCLTDADWLDTEEFCTGKTRQRLSADFQACLHAVNQTLRGFQCETPLQKARAGIQQQVFNKIDAEGHVFLMNMPTGSGKTLAAVKFALERAIKRQKKHIIYVTSYNSIIDQTAHILSNVFGEHAQILRHQSSFDLEKNCDEVDPTILKLATENWDAPIILTTAVQFFESVYSNRRAKLRKLHNMENSILIFDEAHLMPVEYLQPCLQAVCHITKFLNSEAVFLTATMPDYPKLFHSLTDSDLFITELVTDRRNFFRFSKCSYESIGEISDEALIADIRKKASALIVVNSRRTAKNFYTQLKMGCTCKCYHLSTYMTAHDRMRIIAEVRMQLAALESEFPNLQHVPDERRVVLVSTSLIEAGVDLDFEAVYRELNGLDNIIQAGGRCNREGKRSDARVVIFERSENRGKTLSAEANLCKGQMTKYADITSPECIQNYYDRLFFARSDEIKSKSIGRVAAKPTQIGFQTYAEQFRLIDGKSETILVGENEEAQSLISQLQRGNVNFRALREYACTVYQNELKTLMQQGVVQEVKGMIVLTNLDYYDTDTGVNFESHDIFY